MKFVLKERRFPSATGLGPIRFRCWIPEDPVAAVQLTHGMAEHIDRYDAFASFLAEQGVLVYGQDHAGHGKSTPDSPRGYFGPSGGWDALIQDMQTLYGIMKPEYPAIPFILYGHSMGSFLARAYASRRGNDFDGFIFSGTAGKNPALPIAKLITKWFIKHRGGDKPCTFINNLAFGGYNKAVGSNRTEFDWLSVAEDNVDRYVADPLCGFPFTAAAMLDLFTGLGEVSAKNWASAVVDKPILIVSGDKDPVGGKNASGVLEVAKALKQAGRTVECKIYPGDRHEILNEADAQQVAGDIALFIRTVEAMGELE